MQFSHLQSIQNKMEVNWFAIEHMYIKWCFISIEFRCIMALHTNFHLQELSITSLHTHTHTSVLKFKLGKKHICFENVIWWHWCYYFSKWTHRYWFIHWPFFNVLQRLNFKMRLVLLPSSLLLLLTSRGLYHIAEKSNRNSHSHSLYYYLCLFISFE